jgi:t-SNARE complex subunit (syntaxin)
MNIKQMMADDEALVIDIDKGLVKNQNMLKQTMTKIDSVITSASNNVLCYTLLFFIMVLGLLYKLTK